MSYHPFEEHKKHFQSVPIHERSQFLKEVLKTPQLAEESTFEPIPYPHEDTFNFKQYILNYHYAQSTPNPHAIVVFLHGLYGYGGNSGYLGVNVTKAIEGVNFYSLDFLNFGKSKGDFRGYIHSFDWLVEQAEAFVDFLMNKMEEQPKVFLVGESLGGAVSFKMNLRNHERYSGVIFLNPALREFKQTQWFMKKLGKVLGYMAPKLKLVPQSFNSTTKYNTEKITKSNPHMYNEKHVPGSVRVALTAMSQIQKCYKDFKTSYILFQAGVDKSVDIFAPLDLEKQCQAKDKTTIYIKSMWHSTFYEEQIKEITEIVIDWLSKRI